MRIIPQLTHCCMCCSLKTGSFVIAFFLLAAHGVFTGYFSYLVDNVKPQEMCTRYHDEVVYGNRTQYDPRDINWFSVYHPFNGHRFPARGRTALSETAHPDFPGNAYYDYDDIVPSNKMPPSEKAHKETAGARGDVEPPEELATTSNTRQKRSPFFGFGRPYWIKKINYSVPCPHVREIFEIERGYLAFNMQRQYDTRIFYPNIAVWTTMMFLTLLLMYAVYKDSSTLVTLWLLLEIFLFCVASAGTIATSVVMFEMKLPLQTGIVTIINLLLHVALEIYFLMVVYNYRLKLKDKERQEDTELTPV